MAKKVGLLLNAVPTAGGTFQYTLTMLDAVAALPRDEFTPLIAYFSDAWEPVIASYGLPSIAIKTDSFSGTFGRALGKGWRMLDLPVGVWRKISPWIHPVARGILEQKCDLWIFPTEESWTFEIPVPAIGVIHDLMHRYEGSFPEVSANGEYRRRELSYRKICKWSKGVLVDSEIGKKQVIESYQLDPAKIFPLPFIAPPYLKKIGTPPDFESRYQLPKKYFFYPSQLWEHKNHKNLIRALHQLTSRIPDMQLVFAGSKKNAYESIRTLVSELNVGSRVHFLGYVPDEDMAEIYRRARAMIMPTFLGPTNIPPLEAFALGCPVATSRIYGLPEQAGDAALLFNPHSIDEMADAMARLWSDDSLCKDLAEKGLKRTQLWGQPQFNARLTEIIRTIFK